MGLIGLLLAVVIGATLFFYHPFLSPAAQQEQAQVGQHAVDNAQQLKDALQARDAKMMQGEN